MHFASYNTERSFVSSYHFKPDLFVEEREDSRSPSPRHDTVGEIDLADSGYMGSRSQSQTPTQNRRTYLPEETEVESAQGSSEEVTRHHDCQATGCQRVVINVSGLKFETQLRTLNRLPHTLLGDPKKRRRYWDPKRHEYFLDRHRPTFQAVLYFYQSGGRLKRPMEVPPDIFLNELQFYELGGTVIESFQQNEGYLIEKKVPLPQNETMRKLWQTFENPSSSKMAKVIMVISVLFIILSVVGFCMETLPQYQDSACYYITSGNSTDFGGNVSESTASDRENRHGYDKNLTGQILGEANATPRIRGSSKKIASDARTNGDEIQPRPNYQGPFFLMEAMCVSWFTLEFSVRLISCPSKPAFLKSFINWIDVAAILPFFVTLIMSLATRRCVDTSKSGMLMALRVVRAVRIFKLGKHSQALQILAKTLSASLRELSMFAMFLCIAVILFSSAMYHAELGLHPTHFSSIPDSFWYTTVTMTTVGYGDVYPSGVVGKLVGVLCVLSGVLVIALPVPVIVTNFSNYYSHATGRGMTYA